jgi:hypothetical protein
LTIPPLSPSPETTETAQAQPQTTVTVIIMDPESTQLQQSQLAAILGADPPPFETLISHLMSSTDEERSQAEALFNLCKQTDPDTQQILFSEFSLPAKR